MTTDEWYNRLCDTFTFAGLVGGHLVEVHERERQSGEHLVSTYRGQNALIDAFQSFYVETMNITSQLITRDGWPQTASSYSLAFAHFLGLFRRYRACEILFYSGYPLDGYSLLRDIKDRAFLLAAVMHNMSTLSRIMGSVPLESDVMAWRKRRTGLRKGEERRVYGLMYGDHSGLDAAVIGHLKYWDGLFHDEVHGGKLSLSHELDFLSKGMLNRIGPTFHQQAFTVYMNRSAELAWLILRLLPFLQPTANAFGADWFNKYGVLDVSLRHMVSSLTVQLGKPIGEAFCTLVDERFSFAQPFFYFEADGSARGTCYRALGDSAGSACKGGRK